MAAVPDINGRVGQDFAVAVPAAVGGGAPASRVVSTDLAEDLAFAVLPQVQLQVRVTLAVTRCEAETPHPMDLDEVQVKLSSGGRAGERERASFKGRGTLRQEFWIKPAGEPRGEVEGQPVTWSSLLVCLRRCLRKSNREHFRTRMRSVVPSAR